MQSPTSGELSPPFYAESGLLADLDSQVSSIPPHLLKFYARLEQRVGQAFTNLYGHCINPEQTAYFARRQTLFTDPDMAGIFWKDWDENMDVIDATDSALDSSVVHLGYSVGGPPGQDKSPEDYPDQTAIRQYWAGRIAVYPLNIEAVCPVGPEWLMTEQSYNELADDMSNYSEELASYFRFFYSNEIGSNVIHEKVHGIQDWRLPLAILEASAYYYERKTFISNAWHYVEAEDNTVQLADLYEACVKDLGDDVHRLVFGNLGPARRAALLEVMKERFSESNIEVLSKQGDDHSRHIHWHALASANG